MVDRELIKILKKVESIAQINCKDVRDVIPPEEEM
jgi:hypothetical protein